MVDTERLKRKESYSFNRKYQWSRKAGNHIVSFQSVLAGVHFAYKFEIFLQTLALFTYVILINIMWDKFHGVYDINLKFREASLTNDFTKITDDDVQKMIDAMTGVAALWKFCMLFLTMYCFFPVAILSRYIYA